MEEFLIVQLIARKCQGIPFMLLEVHIVVHVVCALAMYAAWLGKSLGINDPTNIDGTAGNHSEENLRQKWEATVVSIIMLVVNISSWRSDQRLLESFYERDIMSNYQRSSPSRGRISTWQHVWDPCYQFLEVFEFGFVDDENKYINQCTIRLRRRPRFPRWYPHQQNGKEKKIT